ncbi:AAA family ATPase [Clostridiaceae bacterium 35-E11]
MQIYVKVLGTPKIAIGNEEIKFSLKKAEALFYYLTVKKVCRKNEVAALLWGDKNDQDAKRNLRITLHYLRNDLGRNKVIMSKGSSLYLNPDIEIWVDIEQFMEDDKDSVNFYTDEFLKNFYVKQALEFENWIDEERLKYKELYTYKLYRRIEENIKKNRYKLIEKDCKTIIANDQFDERAYRLLMKTYFYTGAYNKSIELYNQLVEVLNEELGTSPDPETKALLNEIMLENRYKRNHHVEKDKKFFFGRKEELLYLQTQYALFLKDHSVDPIIIYGEAGVGKSHLCQEFLRQVDADQVHMLTTYCYQEEETFYLKPWHNIALNIIDILDTSEIQISDFTRNTLASLFPELITQADVHGKKQFTSVKEISYENAKQELIYLIGQLTESQKIILVFEDIQWIDKESAKLLLYLLKETKNIYFIGTCRNINHKAVDDFVTLLNKYTPSYEIELFRFTREETIMYAKEVLKGYELTDCNYDTIFHESEGNAFFLNQICINIIENNSGMLARTKIQNALKCRLLGLSNEGQKLLNIISIFYDEVSFEMLKKMTKKDELEILDLIDELKNQDLIVERSVSGNLFIKITHQKLREFLYYEQPTWKRNILHNKVGLLLKEAYGRHQYNHIIYSKLIYHFKHSENILLELKYTVLYLNYMLYLNHECYYADSYTASYRAFTSYLSKKEVLGYFAQIKKMLNTIKPTNDTYEEIKKLEIIYLYMQGRYAVLEGEYTKGIKHIKKMLKQAIEQDYFEYIIKGHKIMIFYGIQIYDKEMIKTYVDKGLALLKNHPYEKEQYLFIRYQGLYKMMDGDFKQAKKVLVHSTKLLKGLHDKGPIDYIELATSYYYLGELKRQHCDFTQAIGFFEKATKTCEENHLGEGLARFKAKAGQSAFGQGNYDLAQKYLEESLVIYNKYEDCWNRPIAEGYLTLIYINRHQYTKALKSLKRAERTCNKIKNPYEAGILNRIKAEIRMKMDKDKKLDKIFSVYVDGTFNDYYNEALQQLATIKSCYEKKVLENLKDLYSEVCQCIQ